MEGLKKFLRSYNKYEFIVKSEKNKKKNYSILYKSKLKKKIVELIYDILWYWNF